MQITPLAKAISESLLGVFVKHGWLKQEDIDRGAELVQYHLDIDTKSRAIDALVEAARGKGNA